MCAAPGSGAGIMFPAAPWAGSIHALPVVWPIASRPRPVRPRSRRRYGSSAAFSAAANAAFSGLASSAANASLESHLTADAL